MSIDSAGGHSLGKYGGAQVLAGKSLVRLECWVCREEGADREGGSLPWLEPAAL